MADKGLEHSSEQDVSVTKFFSAERLGERDPVFFTKIKLNAQDSLLKVESTEEFPNNAATVGSDESLERKRDD